MSKEPNGNKLRKQMNSIKLHFVSSDHLTDLLSDEDFQHEILHLNPERIGMNYIKLFDPVEQHSPLDTELVI